MTDTDVIVGLINRHTPLTNEESCTLAEKLVEFLGLRTENYNIHGADYLGGVSVYRWVSDFRKL